MKFVVCIKRVPNTETRIKIAADGKSIDPTGVQFIPSPYDEFAVEEAIRQKEKAGDGEVIVVCLGPAEATGEIRKCLAMGADKAIHLKDDSTYRDPASTATILAAAIQGLSPDMIFFGKSAADHANSQVGVQVAALLGLPSISEIVSLEVEAGKATAHREIEGGSEVVQTSLPAVFTAQKGLNEPRLPALKGIMAAKKKPIEEVAFEDAPQGCELVQLELPPARAEGKVVGEGADAVPALVKLLREEAKVI
ncbi:MAG: electron transfer flavoprotein subunit beta/FixA family protein [Planctomycetota bacterium]